MLGKSTYKLHDDQTCKAIYGIKKVNDNNFLIDLTLPTN